MSWCDAKKVKIEGEKMKNVKKLKIMALVVIFAMTSLVASCQAASDSSANTKMQLQIKAPSQVWEHTSFQITVSYGNKPISGALVTVGWIPTFFVTDNNGTITITSPWVDRDTQFMIFASKSGFLPAKASITVINLAIP